MEWIKIAIIIMTLIDLTATYNYVSAFHKKFPEQNHLSLEANPILRTAWSKFGLERGTIYGGVIILGLSLLVMMIFSREGLFFYAGTLFMMIIYHGLNWQQLRLMG